MYLCDTVTFHSVRVAVWCGGWDETGWLSGVLVGMILDGCLVCWCAGWDETGWLSGLLFGKGLGGCLVCWLG